MNAKVHPAIAALVIVLAVLAVGVWIWGSGKARELGGPAQLLVGPSGHLFVQIHNQLLEHDGDGAFLRRHDLSALGTDVLIGGIDFFDDGELLLRRGADTRSLLDNVRAFRRETNTQPLTPAAPGTGLYRCDLERAECEPFGESPIDPRAVFSVHVDDASDDVYLADTSRHVLRKYAADGEPLAGPVDGFRFPNELLLFDGRLYVADTNRHRIAIVEPGTAGFAEPIEVADVVPEAARAAGHAWPSHLARVGDGWWVNNMNRAMQYGGVYRFDADWRYRGRVDLPADADPIDIQPFGDEVLVSDWFNDRIHRVSRDGELLGEFTSPGTEALLADYRERRTQYRMLAWSGAVLVGIVLLVLILRAVVAGTALVPPGGDAADARGPEPAPDPEPRWFYPDQAAVARFRRELLVVNLAVFVMVAVLVGKVVMDTGQPLFLLTLLPFVGIAVGLWFLGAFIGRYERTAIGLERDEIVLRDFRGRDSRSLLADVIYTPAMVATPDAAVFLGQGRLKVYRPDDVAGVLMPRLAGARQVSPWRMQRHLATFRRTQWHLAVPLILLAIAAVAALLVIEPVID